MQDKIVAYIRIPKIRRGDKSFELNPDDFLKHTKFANPNMRIAKYYVDEYDSNNMFNAQPELQQLVQDCESGDIRLILVPTCRHFTDEYTNSFEILRKLINLPNPVSIYFEFENVYVKSKDDLEVIANAIWYWDYHRRLKSIQSMRIARERVNQVDTRTILVIDGEHE